MASRAPKPRASVRAPPVAASAPIQVGPASPGSVTYAPPSAMRMMAMFRTWSRSSICGLLLLQFDKVVAKAGGGAPEGDLGVDAQLAGARDQPEEQLAELLGVGRLPGWGHLDPGRRRLPLDLVSVEQRRQVTGNA